VKTDFYHNEMAHNVLALCNNLGDPMEAALWNHVKANGMNPEELSKKYERVYEIPFSSEKNTC
jgi:magnesium-transporting ATPase (P-type)